MAFYTFSIGGKYKIIKIQLIETQTETLTKINSIQHKPTKLQSAKEI